MSAAFTSPAGATWQALLNEITTAYSERRQVIGQSAYVPEANRNVQSAAYWAALQEWLETNCVGFVDYENGPLNDDKNDFIYFTLDNWRAASGLNASGFRRSTDGINFSYGQMQAGDAIGGWIFDDIQKGFGALRWTLGTGIVPDYTIQRNALNVFGDTGGTYEQCKDQLRSEWNAASWVGLGSYVIYATYAFQAYNPAPYDYWYMSAIRYCTNNLSINIPIVSGHPLPCSCAIYSHYVTPDGYVFNDFDGLGATKGWCLWKELEESSDATRTLGSYKNDNLPHDSGMQNGDGDVQKGIVVDNINAVLKWNFTNI